MRILALVFSVCVGMSIASSAFAADNPADSGPEFRMHRVGTYRGEACGVGDFSSDGKLDIVALPFPTRMGANSVALAQRSSALQA